MNRPAETVFRSSFHIKGSIHWVDCQRQRVVLDMDQGKYYAFAGTAGEMWDLLAGGHQPTEIAEILAKKYGITIQTATSDTRAFVSSLAISKLLDPTPPSNPVARPKKNIDVKPGQNNESVKARRLSNMTGPSTVSRIAWFVQSYGMLAGIDVALMLFGFQRVVKVLAGLYMSDELIEPCPQVVASLARVPLAAFRWYRPNVACLHRALVTFWFLRAKAVKAELCLGVATYPFSSHSWVEYEGTVLNDFLATTNKFSIIARIS